jgi:pyridoxamine 5'-phosphate oxidase
MSPQELMNKVEQILEDAKTGILATIDSDGSPHSRWMTPIVLQHRPGCIYTVTKPGSAKTMHIQTNPNVEWMFQTRAITEVVNIKGTATQIDNPALKNEIMESLASKLMVFWKANHNKPDEFVVLETVVCGGVYFKPMKGLREIVQFK